MFKSSKLYFNNLFSIILFIPIILLLLTLIEVDKNLDITNKKQLLIIYPFLLLIIILILGAGFKPLSDFFSFIYTNIHPYGIFRSVTKFGIPLTIFFIIVFYLQLKNKKHYVHIFAVYLILLSPYALEGQLFNNQYFVNIPKDYTNLEKIISKLDDNGVGLIYPNNELMYTYNWGYRGYSPFIFFQSKIPLFYKGTDISNSNGFIFNLLNEDNIQKITANDLQSYNIKYIFLHNDIDCEFYGICKKINDSRIYFNNNFKLLFSNENFNIYEIFEEKTYPIKSKNLYFQQINPTKYKIYISGLKSSQNISFLESFHDDWNLYLKLNPDNSWCKPPEYYKNTNTIECENTQKFFEGEELSYLWEKPIFDSTHRVVNEYANGWTIDPEYIKANYPYEYYRRYIDGSIDIELTLYFKPQSYFYLGIIISTLTFVGCIGYLAWDWRRKRNGQGSLER